jgi:hypothetical protein
MAELEIRVVRKVGARVVPILMLPYFGAYLDRGNLSFAASSMDPDLCRSAGAPRGTLPRGRVRSILN